MVRVSFLVLRVLKISLLQEHGHGHSHDSTPPPSKTTSITTPSRPSSLTGYSSPTPQKKPIRIRSRSRSRSPSGEFSSLYGHPAATRASLVQAANDIALARSPSPTTHRRSMSQPRIVLDAENSAQSPRSNGFAESPIQETHPSDANLTGSESMPLLHNEHSDVGHEHRHHGHSHAGSMNMRALVLHVLGDALGNVGVIATGLIIWLTEWTFKYYCDPIISLIITVIIFSSAMPLGKIFFFLTISISDLLC